MTDLKYAQAMQRLEEIIRGIESEDVDIDELSLKVKEAASLVRVCQDKVRKAEMEVKDVVDSFEKDNI